ncbi:MAG: DUF6339 family protein [Polaromonas sp.]|nr:DUF6339 family protein [Polaromonas sp.]
MISLSLFRHRTILQLYKNIKENLSRYREGDFEFLTEDMSHFIESKCQIDEDRLLDVHCTIEDANEVACCLAVADGLNGVTPYLARDERIWVRLTHIELLHYSRTRWPIPDNDEDAVAHIQKHFFAKSARGIERDNAVSRLWWMATVAAKVEGLKIHDSLQAMLFQSDVRASIIERPSTSQNTALLSALVIQLHKSLLTDQELFERRRFRLLMKRLNLYGGVKLLDVLGIDDLQEMVGEAAKG